MPLQCLLFLIMWYLVVVRMHQLSPQLIIVLGNSKPNSMTGFFKKRLEVLKGILDL